jgi:hypothetical protein
MQRALILAAVFFCAASGDASPLTALSGRDVRVATRLREIEPGAVAALKRQFRDTDRRLADRSAGFEATDAIGPENFPQRRLVLAAYAGDTWFIHYEHGGWGLSLTPCGTRALEWFLARSLFWFGILCV